MKKQIFTKGNGILALCAFVCISLFYVACSKDNATTASDSKDKFTETIYDRIKRYENVTYEHFRYFSLTKPDEYLPEPVRKDFIVKYKIASEKYQGLDLNSRLEKMKDDGIISDISKNKLQTLFGNFRRIGSNKNFYDNAINLINDNVLSLEIDKNLNSKDLDLLLVVLGQAKGYLRYSREVAIANSLSDNNRSLNVRCDPNEREQCRLEMMAGGGIIGLAWGPFGGIAGALVGAITGIFACCSVDNTCEKPTFAVNNFVCTDNSATVTALYTNGGQRETEFNAPQGGLIQQILSNVSVRVRQTGSSPISMNAFAICNDGFKFKSDLFIVDIKDIANNPGWVSFSGESNGIANSTSTYFFSSRVPQNTTYQIELSGSIGSVVQTYNNAVTIRWFRSGNGAIRVKAINSFSGQAIFSDIINLTIR